MNLQKKIIVSKNGSPNEDDIVFRLNININNLTKFSWESDGMLKF